MIKDLTCILRFTNVRRQKKSIRPLRSGLLCGWQSAKRCTARKGNTRTQRQQPAVARTSADAAETERVFPGKPCPKAACDEAGSQQMGNMSLK